MSKPLLSICIPTYNRADYLRNCLLSIVDQEGFEDIEVVISDNCSNDNTESVGKQYEQEYDNIIYYRNEDNIADKNFPLVLQRANGVLRKLTNDTIVYKPGAIKYMLDAVKENIYERPQVYFLNKDIKRKSPMHYQELEEYVGNISFLLTWIGSISIWEDDSDDLATFTDNTDSKLAQVPFLIEHFEKHNGAMVYANQIMEEIIPKNKNLSYGLYQVFYINFMSYIKTLVMQKKISSNCYDKVRKNLLMDFFCPWIINQKYNKNGFIFSEDEDLPRLILNEYKNEPYFFRYKLKLSIMNIKKILHNTVTSTLTTTLHTLNK